MGRLPNDCRNRGADILGRGIAFVFFLLSVLGAGCVAGAAMVTSAQPGKAIFFALGDHGVGNKNQRRVAHAMERVASQTGGVDWVLLLGDNFYPKGVVSDKDPKWQSHFESIYDGPILANTPFYAVLGNHDAGSSLDAQVDYGRNKMGSGRWRMEGRQYVVDHGQTTSGQPLLRMVMLDGQQDVEIQKNFVRQAFSQPSNQPMWRMVASHYPLHSSGLHGDTNRLLNELLPILQAEKIDVYFCGHDHDLEMIAPPGEPVQIISGAGGADLYALREKNPWSQFFAKRFGFVQMVVSEQKLDVTFFEDQGNVLYNKQIARRGR
ncbi:MAG: metallophosphoesterase [Magnetococcales bacterium]|nr:metallophosphoesterase [Magnetococcales bacterium]